MHRAAAAAAPTAAIAMAAALTATAAPATITAAAVVMRLAAAVAAAERKGLRFSSLIKITETDLSHLIGQVCFFRNKRKEPQCLQNLN